MTTREPTYWKKMTLLVQIPYETYKEWDTQCDEIFHGAPGQLHDPDKGIYVVEYVPISETEAENSKFSFFTEDGGI